MGDSNKADLRNDPSVERYGLTSRLLKSKEVGIFSGLLILFVLFSLLSEFFFSLENLLNVVRQVSILGIIAIGMTMVIVTGEIDLSVGATYSFAAMVTGLLMNRGVPIPVSILVGLLCGGLVGLINGTLITYGRIPSIIVTLGTLNIVRGMALLMTNSMPVIVNERTVSNPNLPGFLYLGQGKVFGEIPVMALIFFSMAVLGWFVFHKSLYGYHMRAVGGSSLAARASGLNVNRLKTLALVITGFLSALAGILNLAFITNVRATGDAGLELNAISAVVIGGTSMAGGDGTIIGTIIGVLIIGVIKNGLVLLGISPFWQTMIIGFVIIGAVAVDVWTKKGRK